MFTGKSIGKILFNCTNCGVSTTFATKITIFSVKNYTSIQEHINAAARKTKKCSHCDENIFQTHKYNSPPRL
jgi:ribosomal protein S27AE